MTPKYGPFQEVLWFSAGVITTTLVVNNWILVGCLVAAALLVYYVTRVTKFPAGRPHNVIPVGSPFRKTTY